MILHRRGRRVRRGRLLLFFCMLVSSLIRAADEKPAGETTVKYRVNGMFSPDRQEDLRQAAAKLADFKLVTIDYDNAEVTFCYDSSKVLKGAKPDHVLNTMDSKLREASNHTLGLMNPITNREKLQRVEVHVGMLDCKACGLGVYWIVTKVPGVEQATVDIKDGHVIAWLDPEKTKRADIVEMLKMREVTVKDP